MSCKKFEFEMFESFGSGDLSLELQTHLENCSACQVIYQNLQSVSTEIGSDELFFESDETVNKRVEEVNSQIDQLELSKVVEVSSRWKAYVPMAAALFLVFGVGLITKFALQFVETPETAEISQVEVLFVAFTDDDAQSLTEIEFSEFVDDYTTEYTLDYELKMLDEMTEEEYNYLEENLNIGEIL